jgi:hypothetical protein
MFSTTCLGIKQHGCFCISVVELRHWLMMPLSNRGISRLDRLAGRINLPPQPCRNTAQCRVYLSLPRSPPSESLTDKKGKYIRPSYSRVWIWHRKGCFLCVGYFDSRRSTCSMAELQRYKASVEHVDMFSKCPTFVRGYSFRP